MSRSSPTTSATRRRYLRDLELATLLQEMVDKGLYTTLVLVCCHSGGATRVARTTRPSAGWSSNTIPSGRPGHLTGAEVDDPQRELGSGRAAGAQGIHPAGGLPPGRSWPTRPRSTAATHGALTYWLLDAFQKIGPDVTYKMVHEQILARVDSQVETRRPCSKESLAGWSSGWIQFPGVRRAGHGRRRPQRRVLLQAGQATGVLRASQFAIYPPDVVTGPREGPQGGGGGGELGRPRAGRSW